MAEASHPTGSSLSLNQRRIRASRLDLALAALEVMERDGWEALGVAELAAEVGMSTRTFYRYFPSKRDVFRPLLAEAGIRSRARFAEPTHDAFPEVCANALVAGVMAFPGGLRGAQSAYRILLSTPELTPVWLDEALSFENGLAPYLPSDVVPAGSEALEGGIDDRRLVTALVFASMRVAIQAWVENVEAESLHPLTVHAVSRALGRQISGGKS